MGKSMGTSEAPPAPYFSFLPLVVAALINNPQSDNKQSRPVALGGWAGDVKIPCVQKDGRQLVVAGERLTWKGFAKVIQEGCLGVRSGGGTARAKLGR